MSERLVNECEQLSHVAGRLAGGNEWPNKVTERLANVREPSGNVHEQVSTGIGTRSDVCYSATQKHYSAKTALTVYKRIKKMHSNVPMHCWLQQVHKINF